MKNDHISIEKNEKENVVNYNKSHKSDINACGVEEKKPVPLKANGKPVKLNK